VLDVGHHFGTPTITMSRPLENHLHVVFIREHDEVHQFLHHSSQLKSKAHGAAHILAEPLKARDARAGQTDHQQRAVAQSTMVLDQPSCVGQTFWSGGIHLRRAAVEAVHHTISFPSNSANIAAVRAAPFQHYICVLRLRDPRV
jgi:hypothetical protein